MSLEGLFIDRKARKYIKDSILEAKEINEGVCNKCGKTVNHLMVAFGKNLCEDCCESIINQVDEDYDTVYESADDEYIVENLILEGFVTGDFNKLRADAANAGLTEYKYVLNTYDVDLGYSMGGKYKTEDKIRITKNDLASGNTKINRFIDDYSLSFEKPKELENLVPDTDGYLSNVKSSIQNTASITPPAPKTPAPVQSTSTTTQTTPKQVTAKGKGFTVSGDEAHFVIKISDDISLDCTQTMNSTGAVNYDVKVDGTSDTMAYTVKQGSVKDMANEILGYIKETPSAVFTAFDDEFDSSKGYILAEYPSYSFMFDGDSFDGKNLTLVLALNGKPYTQTRIALSKRDILSKASLDGKLLKALKGTLSKFYPVLFDGSMNIKTSIGKSVSTFVLVDNSNKVKIHTEIGNIGFDWEVSGKMLNDKEQSINSMLFELYDKHMDKIFPDWIKMKSKVVKPNPKFTDSFECEDGLNPKSEYTIYANFSLQDMYDKHAFIFHMSVIDTKSGIEQPKEYVPITYTKPGVKVEDFMQRAGAEIYNKYFKKSDMVNTISAKAQEKIKNKSKKVVFLNHVADKLRDALVSLTPNSVKNNLKDLDIDIEKFDVNSDYRVTDVVFRVSDPFNDLAGNSDDLEKAINLDSLSWIKMIGKSTSQGDLKKYGPSVLYSVTKMEDFSGYINLPVLESAMLEAFGIERKGRKVIGVNEAYFVEDNGEYRLLF